MTVAILIIGPTLAVALAFREDGGFEAWLGAVVVSVGWLALIGLIAAVARTV